MKRTAIVFLALLSIISLISCSKVQHVVVDEPASDTASDFQGDYILNSEGRILMSSNGFLIVSDTIGTVLLVSSEDGIFEGLSNGDLVELKHGPVMESYPGQTDAYEIKKLEEGSLSDIAYETLDSLAELGWIDRESVIGSVSLPEGEEIVFEYGYADISLKLPCNWEFIIEEFSEGCTSFGVNFRPKGVKEGWMKLHCYNGAFAVCGTGLETEHTKISEYDAIIGRYDGKSQYDYIRFIDSSGEYVLLNFVNVEWFSECENEIMSILETAELGKKQISKEKVASVLELYDIDLYSDDVFCLFDAVKGVWEVKIFNGSNNPWYVNLNHKGEIISSNYIAMLEV